MRGTMTELPWVLNAVFVLGWLLVAAWVTLRRSEKRRRLTYTMRLDVRRVRCASCRDMVPDTHMRLVLCCLPECIEFDGMDLDTDSPYTYHEVCFSCHAQALMAGASSSSSVGLVRRAWFGGEKCPRSPIT